MNKAILTALFAVFTAQILKPLIAKIKNGQWEWGSIVEPGGMPSSHSAGVTSLATYIALHEGFASMDFALSVIFGLIVMYDAAGIRRHAGEIAMEVNELDQEVEKLSGNKPGVFHRRQHRELKERLGHQPIEVLGGAILGIIIGFLG